MKVKNYKDKFLTNGLVSVKIDGVRVHINNGVATSRTGKPLYNIPEGVPDGVYEAFRGSFKETISIVRASDSERVPLGRSELFMLYPQVDPRIVLVHFDAISPAEAHKVAELSFKHGQEGIVIHSAEGMFKLKKEETHDVLIKGFVEGTGRNKGTLGSIITDKGKVGIGFTDAMRDDIWSVRDSLLGTYIECSSMEITAAGMMRMPKFIRFRPDKSE